MVGCGVLLQPLLKKTWKKLHSAVARFLPCKNCKNLEILIKHGKIRWLALKYSTEHPRGTETFVEKLFERNNLSLFFLP